MQIKIYYLDGRYKLIDTGNLVETSPFRHDNLNQKIANDKKFENIVLASQFDFRLDKFVDENGKVDLSQGLVLLVNYYVTNIDQRSENIKFNYKTCSGQVDYYYSPLRVGRAIQVLSPSELENVSRVVRNDEDIILRINGELVSVAKINEQVNSYIDGEATKKFFENIFDLWAILRSMPEYEKLDDSKQKKLIAKRIGVSVEHLERAIDNESNNEEESTEEKVGKGSEGVAGSSGDNTDCAGGESDSGNVGLDGERRSEQNGADSSDFVSDELERNSVEAEEAGGGHAGKGQRELADVESGDREDVGCDGEIVKDDGFETVAKAKSGRDVRNGDEGDLFEKHQGSLEGRINEAPVLQPSDTRENFDKYRARRKRRGRDERSADVENSSSIVSNNEPAESNRSIDVESNTDNIIGEYLNNLTSNIESSEFVSEQKKKDSAKRDDSFGKIEQIVDSMVGMDEN